MNDKFSGDMGRNEVELDLNKFMDLLQEQNKLKDRIRELESGVNPWQKAIFIAHAVDSWRIFPRLFLGVYIFLLYYATMWFMELPDPSIAQSGLIATIVGAGAAWFGLYTGTGKDKK
jgi:hypothetical protein